MATPGTFLEARFDQLTVGRPNLGEVALFDELMASFPAMGQQPGVQVERYHGTKSQVKFQPAPVFQLALHQCELADLMILVYRAGRPPTIRFTFFQAKYTDRALPLGGPPLHAPRATADQLQWDLLSRRPPITPVGSVSVPSRILADALLGSVGSFGFFHRRQAGHYGLAYAAADVVRPVQPLTRVNPPPKGRVMTFPGVTTTRVVGGVADTFAAQSIRDLGDHLAGLQIGTVIQPQARDAWNRQVMAWVRGVLRSHTGGPPTDSTSPRLARELLGLTDGDNPDHPLEPDIPRDEVPRTMILRVNHEAGRPD